MGMPEVAEKQNDPGLPQASVSCDNQDTVDDSPERSPATASLRSTVELKKKILQTEDKQLILRLADHIRFRTSSQQMSTIREYIRRMVNGQQDIYYMVGRSPQQLLQSPFVRRFLNAGLEVIFMTDPILDELVVKKLNKHYDHFRLISVKSEAIEVPLVGDEKLNRRKRHREALDEFLPLCKRLKSVYPHQIQKIVISNTLVESSCAMIPCEEMVDDEKEPFFNVNAEWGRIRLEINPDSDSLRLLCLQARLLEKKQEQFDDLVKFLFGPPTTEDSVVIEQPFSPSSNDSFSELSTFSD
ncbi:hypothetical protein GHT06_016173 [Daphnia sinensis]|uniref:Uncharacterized protein n=1 Tax=Daphnia sinensis TaxID=1820382 RepID=A0AAD5KRX6_9CRUS|nr:hypothetical protein GHT06_016173 [Daphnia sinensis]